MRKIILILIYFFLINKTIVYAQEDYIINYFKSFSYFEQKNYDLAQKYIDIAISSKQQNINLQIFKALIFENKKEYQKSILLLKQIEQYNKQSQFMISRLYSLLKMPDSSLFYLNKYLNASNTLLKYQIVTDTAFDNIRNTTKWQIFWDKAEINPLANKLNDAYFKYTNSEFIDAIDICNQILNKNPKYYQAYYLKAEILTKVDNYDEAAKNYQKALNINPFNTEILNKAAFCYQKIGNFKKTTELYNKSLKINPLQPKIFTNYVFALNQNNQYQEAIEKIDFYLEFFPSDIEAQYLKIQIYINSGDYLEALKLLNNLPKNEQKAADFYLLRGQIYLQTKSYEQSYYDFSQCLDINPQKKEIYFYRGFSSLYINDINKACQDWQTAIKNKDYRANTPFFKYCKNY